MISAVVVSRANGDGLRNMIENLLDQSIPPAEIKAYCAAYTGDELERLRAEYPIVEFYAHDDVPDWGHSARARGLRAAEGNWVGFFNDDDRYELHYIERMLDAAVSEDADVVFCAWNEQPECVFALSRSTAGNFLVRTHVAHAAGGWPDTPVYENDGHFIEAIKGVTDRIVKVDDRPVLYHHNA